LTGSSLGLLTVTLLLQKIVSNSQSRARTMHWEESSIARQIMAEAAARGAQYRVRAHERRWRRRSWRLGLAALLLTIIFGCDQIARVVPDHPPVPRPVWPLLLAFGLCCTIGGLWGGVFCLTFAFTLLAWRIHGLGFDAWLWWSFVLPAAASFLLVFVRFGRPGGGWRPEHLASIKSAPPISGESSGNQQWNSPLPAGSWPRPWHVADTFANIVGTRRSAGGSARQLP
jgi:hypothetical protein